MRRRAPAAPRRRAAPPRRPRRAPRPASTRPAARTAAPSPSPPSCRAGVDVCDLRLLRLQPPREGGVARQVDPLAHGDDRRQRQSRRSPSRRRPRAAPSRPPSPISMPLTPVTHRQPEHVRHADADLVAARVGRLVAEEQQVEGRRPAHRVRDRRGGRLRVPVARRRSRAGSRAPMPIATASRSCSAAAGGPSVSTVVVAAVRGREPDRLLDRALLVRADRVPEEGVSTAWASGRQGDPRSGLGHALDADEDVHRLMRAFSGSKSGREPATSTVTGYRSPMYCDEQLRRPRRHAPAAGRPSGCACRRTAPTRPSSRTSRGPSGRRSARRPASGSARGRACSACTPDGRGVVVDRQRAEHRRRLLLALRARTPPCRRSPRPSPSAAACPPRRRRTPTRARRRRGGSPSRSGRSCRRRRSRPGRRRAAAPPPRARPRARARSPSAHTAPSRGRRRTRSARRGRAPGRSRPRGSATNGKPSCETSSLVTDASRSRARGPQTPTVHHADVDVEQRCRPVRRADGRGTT